MESRQFSDIRNYLGKTQSELATLLCVSSKTVQSFEQGWRNIPPSAERQLLVLLSLKKSPEPGFQPCWQTTDCPEDWRHRCVVWEHKVRHYCWLINGTFWQGEVRRSWKKKMEVCWRCKVLQSMLPPVS